MEEDLVSNFSTYCGTFNKKEVGTEIGKEIQGFLKIVVVVEANTRGWLCES